MLGSLPGKIVLQGNQLAALTQAKNAQGQPAKVVTIQLQVQQPQQKIQIVPQPPSSQPQPQQPPSAQPVTLSSVQQAQIMGPGQSPGQRLSVPLKVVLQPQVRFTQLGTKTDLLVLCSYPQQPLTVESGAALDS